MAIAYAPEFRDAFDDDDQEVILRKHYHEINPGGVVRGTSYTDALEEFGHLGVYAVCRWLMTQRERSESPTA